MRREYGLVEPNMGNRSVEREMRRKNIVVLVADQLRFDALGTNGNPLCRTPNIDALAGNGASFRRAYTSCPLCSPARASILTGLFPHRHGLLTNSGQGQTAEELPEPQATFSRILTESGYTCGYVGKWHVGRRLGPADWGFDEKPSQSLSQYLSSFRGKPRVSNPISSEVNQTRFVLAASRDGDPHQDQTGYCVQEGVRMISRLVRADRPFLVRIDFVAPHPPYIVPEPYASMYDPEAVHLPRSVTAESRQGKPRVHAIQGDRWGTTGLADRDWREIISMYYGLVTQLDDAVGRILGAIDDLRLTEDTVVILTSDHGDAVGDHRMYDKGYCMYEEQVRIPLIVRHPDRFETSTLEDWVSLVDLMPTILEVGGCGLPVGIDGTSLLGPILEGKSIDRESIFCEFHGMQYGLASIRMVRNARFKYVLNANDVNELYDLETDPAELRNVAGDDRYDNAEAAMHDLLLTWMRKTDDPLLATLWGHAAYDPSFRPPPDNMWVL